MSPTLATLHSRMNHVAYSTEGVALIQRIAATDEPETIAVLASMLDIPGVIGKAAVRALIERGDVVARAMRACLDSDDSDMIARAKEVLAALRSARKAAANREVAKAA